MHNSLIKITPAHAAYAVAALTLTICGLVLISRSTAVQAQTPAAAPAAITGPPPAPAAPSSTFDQRLAQRKAERNVVIAPRDQQRLVNVCVSAQTKLRTLQQKTTPAVAARAKTNQQIDAKLWIMTGKLKLAERDTFQLEKQRAALADKVSVFQQTTQSYTQALDDVVAVDCRADLAGFKALLDTSRLYRTQVRDQSTDLRNYLNNDIKPALSTFASDLQVKPSTEAGR